MSSNVMTEEKEEKPKRKKRTTKKTEKKEVKKEAEKKEESPAPSELTPEEEAALAEIFAVAAAAPPIPLRSQSFAPLVCLGPSMRR